MTSKRQRYNIKQVHFCIKLLFLAVFLFFFGGGGGVGYFCRSLYYITKLPTLMLMLWKGYTAYYVQY